VYRSRMFWRLFGTFGVLWLVSIGLLGAVIVNRVRQQLPDEQDAITEITRLIWTAVAITGALSLSVAFWLARRISQPMQELTDATERIAAGGYGHKVYASGMDEVGTLANTFNHMSERLAAQFAQLEEDRQQLRTILSGMVEGVVALDAEQRILFANERAAELLEFQPNTAVGRKLWEVVRQSALQEIVQQALNEPGAHRQELNWNGPTVRSLTVHAAWLPAAGGRHNGHAEGEPRPTPARGAVLVLHDTTELRRLERLRQEFVANVSHELKTPLTNIKAYVETLLEGAVEDPQHRVPFLEKVAEQSERLHALILDLLSLARIESGNEMYDFQDVPLGPAVASCLERYRGRAEARGQTLVAVPPEPGDTVDAWADEEAVNQILENLVDNALKYTPPGGRITVRWGVAPEAQVFLEVEDTGIGIPEADLPRIFERFYRVDKARSREMGGTGLGLSIVKHLVSALHGTIRATSRLGQGSTFKVFLPAAPA
jgi:two-component system phosphate regulon sensor histidine kinase PhoR